MLLIDEVDRADDEFEAFLFELLAEAAVTIPELGTRRARPPPIAVLTSNRTRDLHDALRRRCLYHWIGYPDAAPGRRDRPPPGAGRARTGSPIRSPARSRGCAALDLTQAARRRRGDQLGDRAARARPPPRSTAAAAERTLGAVLKYREDADVARRAGLARLVGERVELAGDPRGDDLAAMADLPLGGAVRRGAARAPALPVGAGPCERFARAITLVAAAHHRASCTGAPAPRWSPTRRRSRSSTGCSTRCSAACVDPADGRGDPDAPRRRPRARARRATAPEPRRRRRCPRLRGRRRHRRAAGRRRLALRAVATAAERLAGRDFADLTADELPLLADADAPAHAGHAAAPRRAAPAACRHGDRIDLRATLRAGARAPAATRCAWSATGRAAAARAGWSCCATSPARWSRTRGPCCSCSTARPAPARAEVFTFATRLTRLTRVLARARPGGRAGTGRAGRAGLVRRHPHRAPRCGSSSTRYGRRGHGPRRGRADHLRRLGDRRPGAAGPGDGPAVAAGLPDRLGQPAHRRARATGRWSAAWRRRGRTATRWSARTAWTRWPTSWRRSPIRCAAACGPSHRAAGVGRRSGQRRDAQPVGEPEWVGTAARARAAARGERGRGGQPPRVRPRVYPQYCCLLADRAVRAVRELEQDQHRGPVAGRLAVDDLVGRVEAAAAGPLGYISKV